MLYSNGKIGETLIKKVRIEEFGEGHKGCSFFTMGVTPGSIAIGNRFSGLMIEAF